MNGRERIAAALSPEGTPEIGVVIPYEGIFIRDHWDDLCSEPWWVRITPDTNVQYEWRREVAQKIGQDWFDLPSGTIDEIERNTFITEENGAVVLVDKNEGTQKELIPPKISGWPETTNASIHPIYPPDTPEEIDAWIGNRVVPGQDLNITNCKLPHRILNNWGAQYFPMGYINGPLWSCYYMWGFEGLMTRIIDKPQLVHYAVTNFTQSTLEEIDLYSQTGVMGLWLEDCMTDMISNQHFDHFNKRYIRKITEYAKLRNLRIFHYFCGDPKGKWEHLLDTGADALSLEESKKAFTINIEDVVERVDGHMTVLGNLDAIKVLEQANDEGLITELRRQIAAGHRNNHRFIMSLGSPVTPDTPVERVRNYIRYTHEIGRS